jgi:hypothetical protein
MPAEILAERLEPLGGIDELDLAAATGGLAVANASLLAPGEKRTDVPQVGGPSVAVSNLPRGALVSGELRCPACSLDDRRGTRLPRLLHNELGLSDRNQRLAYLYRPFHALPS